jgi:hypothetical protein
MTSDRDISPNGASRQQVADLLARISRDAEEGEQRRVLADLVRVVGANARAAVLGGGRWLADTLVETVPKLPVRDAATLHAHHPAATDDEIAAALAVAAAKATMAVGAAGGALAAVEFTAPPTLLTVPVQLAAETLAVAAIEVKLVAELHEIYGACPPGTGRDRAFAYLQAWTSRRGIDPLNPRLLAQGFGVAAKRQIRRRLVGRAGRNLSTLGPFLTGAVAGAAVNRRETQRLAQSILTDLRAGRELGGP